MNIDNLIIPNKNEFVSFYNKCINTHNYNIAITGPENSCKSIICNLLINSFIEHNNIKDNDKKKTILFLNYYDDINLQNELNDLTIFCNNNVNSNKLIYIDNFDYYNEQNQQVFKTLIDKYNTFKQRNKIYFLIESSNMHKIKDIIKSRIQVYQLEMLSPIEKELIFDNIGKEREITIEKNVLQDICQSKNISTSIWKNFLTKVCLLNIKNIDAEIIRKYLNDIDTRIFDKYFENILLGNEHECNKILTNLYVNGYDLGDIYFYMYEYIKDRNNANYYICIKILCEYINEQYNGHYNKIMLVFLTKDIRKCLLEN